jgi:hypothetical protein
MEAIRYTKDVLNGKEIVQHVENTGRGLKPSSAQIFRGATVFVREYVGISVAENVILHCRE